jgi:hypothetical protein
MKAEQRARAAKSRTRKGDSKGASTTANRGISDETVRKKTGRTWNEWRRALDTAGAGSMSHHEIAATSGINERVNTEQTTSV